MDQVRYDDGGGWMTDADGLGMSLQRLCFAHETDVAHNWVAAGPTPSAANALQECPPATPSPPPIAINEINYHPPDAVEIQREYIELVNTTDATIDLLGWQFTQGVTFVFEESTP